MKLYLVTLQGMWGGYGSSYVVATDPTAAYTVVRKFLDEHNLGFYKDRELQSVKLVADTNLCGDCGTILHIQGREQEAGDANG